jgi:uncharacterized protein (DUF433 family)
MRRGARCDHTEQESDTLQRPRSDRPCSSASAMPTRSYTRGMSTDRITADPARMAGAPTIRNTRVTVTAVLGQLAAGRTIDEILADYPYLEREDILAVLEFATESIERELPITAA